MLARFAGPRRYRSSMPPTGTPETKLIVLRGNSGSGKSSTARELRARFERGIAWIEQDYLRRIVLRERDVPNGVNIGLIERTVRYALDNSYDVILDGILDARHYGAMLTHLTSDHAGTSAHYYFDVSWEETLRRHSTRRQATEFTPDQMREWFAPRDLLGSVKERIIPESATH